MAQDVINALFPGDSHDLLTRYSEGVRRFREAGGTPPEHAILAHTEAGLHVTLVWGEGIDHALLGNHMRGLLGELGLPMPRVIHGDLATTSWESLAPVGA
jgi:hypothetical protein